MLLCNIILKSEQAGKSLKEYELPPPPQTYSHIFIHLTPTLETHRAFRTFRFPGCFKSHTKRLMTHRMTGHSSFSVNPTLPRSWGRTSTPNELNTWHRLNNILCNNKRRNHLITINALEHDWDRNVQLYGVNIFFTSSCFCNFCHFNSIPIKKNYM